MNILVDIDDTINNLAHVWLNFYNDDYKDKLQYDELTDWDWAKIVKPECGKNIYSYLHDRDLYTLLSPVRNSLSVIKYLKSKGHRVTYITARDYLNNKFDWLKTYEFIDDISDFVIAYDKSLIRGEYIIDDKYENVINFDGIGILMNQPWNAKYRFGNRASNWNEVKEYFR